MLWPSPASYFLERETLAREASDFPEISPPFGDKLAAELHTLASLGLRQMVMYLLPCFLPLLVVGEITSRELRHTPVRRIVK